MRDIAIVRSLSDLDALPHRRDVNGLVRRSQIRLDLPNVPLHAQLEVQRNLNRLQSRCGCVAATLCLFSILGVGGHYVIRQVEPAMSLGFLMALVAVGAIAVVFSIAAKLLVLQITRVQFAKACKRARVKILIERE